MAKMATAIGQGILHLTYGASDSIVASNAMRHDTATQLTRSQAGVIARWTEMADRSVTANTQRREERAAGETGSWNVV